MNGSVKIYLFFLLGFLLLFSGAAEPGRTLRVGFFHFAGYHEIGKNGEKSGYGYEYLQKLRKYTGWKFEYIGYDKTWADMMDMLERGEIDFVTGAMKTSDREKKFGFSSSPIGNSAVLLTVKEGHTRYRPGDYRNWGGIRVGLLRRNLKNDAFDAFAREKGFRYVPVWFDNVSRMSAALQEEREIDAAVSGSLRRLNREWVYEQIDAQPFYVIVKKGNPLLGKLNDAMDRLRMDSPSLFDELHNKYYTNCSRGTVLFSSEERTFIQESQASGQVFLALINPDRSPFSFFRKGSLRGIFKDIADEISKRSGIKFEFIRAADRDAYRRSSNRDGIDLIFDLRHDYSLAEELDCVLTEPYFSAVISRIRQKSFSGEPRSVALVRDSDVAVSAIRYGLGDAELVYYDSNTEVIDAVRSGQQDTGLIYTRTAEKAILHDNLGILESEVVGGLATPYAIGVKSHCDPRLISILDKTVRSIRKGDIDKLVMKHMDVPRRSRTLLERLMANHALSFGIVVVILLATLVFSALLWILKRDLWRYGKVVSRLPLRFFVIDGDGHILAGTPLRVGSAVRGRRPRRISDLPDGEFRSLMSDTTREVLSSGKGCTVDFDFNGRKHSAEVLPLPGKLFPVPAVIWIAMDTTKLQDARAEAQFNAERFKLTLRSIGDGVLVTDENGSVTMLNEVAEQLTGWSMEEALGRPHEKIFKIRSYLDDSPVVSPVRNVLKDGKIVTLANHIDLIARDGRRRHIADSAAPVRDGSGKIIGTILVFRDVTEEYAGRSRLREALTSLEYASELTDAAAFLFNPATRKMTGSKILPRLWGINEDGVAVSMREWVFRDDRKTMLRAWAELARGKVDVMTAEYRSERSGGMRYYRMRASVDRSNPRDLRFVGVIQDVTEIVQSSGRLKKQEALWEKVINAMPVMFFAKDADDSFRYVLCNRGFADFIGKTPAEVIGKTDRELFASGEAEVFQGWDRAIMEKLEGESFEEKATDCNGFTHHVRTVKQPFIGPDGRRLLLGTSSDITELNRLIISEQINSEVLAQAVAEVDTNRVLENLAGTLRRHTNCDRVTLVKSNKEGKLRLYQEWSSDSTRPLRDIDIETLYRLWDSNLPVMQKNQVLIIPDMSEYESSAGMKHDENYRTQSLIEVPVFIENKLWGALFASYSTRKHGFTENDERLMRSCANVIALAEIRNRQRLEIERADFEKQMIFNNIRIPLWLHDGEGKLLQANNAVYKLAGIPAGESLTTERNWEVFYSGMPIRPVNDVIETGRPVRREVAFRGGEYIVNAEPVFDEDGKLIYIVKSAVDITELNAVLENQKVVNFCLETLLGEEDMEHAILLALEAVCRHLGATRSYILQFNTEKRTMSSVVEYVVPGREPVFSHVRNQPYSAKPEWVERFRQNPDIIIEDFLNIKDASEVGELWLETARHYHMRSCYARRLMLDSDVWGYLGMVFEDEPRHFTKYDGQFVSAVAHFVELMLERRRAQEQILSALKKAQAANKAKSYFLATMSHEIRTPLNAVIGFSELLKSGSLTREEQTEYLDSITLAGNSLLRLINDVLDLSKLEAEQTVLTPQPTDLAALAREIQAIFQYKVQEKKLFFRLDCPKNLPMLKLDNLRLRQILLNLIGNAVKFTGQGGITLGIEFLQEPGADDGTLTIRVQDTGVGIAKDVQQRIFEPFVQSDAARDTHVYNGTGLGLAISRRLVERMNGVISLESEPGKGCCFIIRLENVELAESAAADAETKAPAPSSSASGGFRILIVDDVPMNLKVLAALLRKLKTEPYSVSSGAEALELLKRQKMDIVLTDMRMPEMDGAALAENIHSLPGCAELPVIVVTADTESCDTVPMTHFDGVLLKPVSFEKLTGLLGKYRKMPEENPFRRRK